MPGTWTWFNTAKQKLGTGSFDFTQAGDYLLTLHISSNAAAISNDHSVTTLGSVDALQSQLATNFNYVQGGKTLSSNAWYKSADAYAFCSNGVCWSANGGSFANLRYAVIRLSATAANSGIPIMFATLSTSLITVADGSAIKINGGEATSTKIFALS